MKYLCQDPAISQISARCLEPLPSQVLDLDAQAEANGVLVQGRKGSLGEDRLLSTFCGFCFGIALLEDPGFILHCSYPISSPSCKYTRAAQQGCLFVVYAPITCS